MIFAIAYSAWRRQHATNGAMPIEFDPSCIPNRHAVRYRVLDACRAFPTRQVDVLASEQEIQAFVRDGFLERQRLVPEHELVRLRAAFDDVIAKDDRPEHGGASFGGTFVRHMEDKHPLFFELIAFPPVLSVMRALLGPNVQLRGITGRLCRPEEPNQQTEWHFHQRVIPNPLPPLFSRPHTIDALLYLDDVDEHNGPLCVLPGSYQRLHDEHRTNDFTDYAEQVVLELPAGSVVFVHGSTWHRTKPTHPTGRPRRMIILGYGPSWIKPSIYGEKPANGLTAQRLPEADDELKELLGVSGYM